MPAFQREETSIFPTVKSLFFSGFMMSALFAGYLSSNAILFISASLLILLTFQSLKAKEKPFGLELLLLFFVSIISLWIYRLDLPSLLKSGNSPFEIWKTFTHSYPDEVKRLREFLSLGIFLFGIGAARKCFLTSKVTTCLLEAALWSVPFIVALAQLSYFDNLLPRPLNSSFWLALDRSNLTFTDPNSAGIASFIVVTSIAVYLTSKTPLSLFQKYRGWILFFSWCLLGFSTGSRSFVLGGGITLLVVSYYFSKKLLAVLTGALVTSIILLSQFSEPLSSYEILPSGLRRTLNSFRSEGDQNDSFQSRAIFFEASILVWKRSPIYGAGFNRFEDELNEVTNLLPSRLDGWSDNPNSFYLGILSEGGIIGVLMLLLSLMTLRSPKVATLSEKIHLAASLAFAVLLILGPHTDFFEVSVLSSIFISFRFSPVPFKRRLSIFLCLISLLSVLFYFPRFGEFVHGVYGTQKRHHSYTTQRQGVLHLKCLKEDTVGDGFARLSYTLPVRKPEFRAISVKFTSPDTGFTHESALIPLRHYSLLIKCNPDITPLVRVDFKCSDFWTTKEVDFKGNRRIRCLRIKY